MSGRIVHRNHKRLLMVVYCRFAAEVRPVVLSAINFSLYFKLMEQALLF